MTDGPRQADLPGQQGIHRRLMVGWLSKGMGITIAFGEQILLVPLFLIVWGPDRYGDWLVLLSTAGFVLLLDMGLQTYYANSMQAALSQGKHDTFRRLFQQGTALYVTIICGSLFLIVVVGNSAPWTHWLNLKETMTGSTENVLLVLILYFLTTLPFGMANAVYRAHGHFATSIMVGNLTRLLLLSGIAIALWGGADLVTLALVYMATIMASWAAMIGHQRQRYPDLRYGISWPDRDALKDLLSIAPLYAVVPAAMLVTTHATIILISTLASAGKAVVMYSTMRTLTAVTRMVLDQIMHVTGVEIARQFAEGDKTALTTLYNFVARLAGGICGTLAGLIAIIGSPFLAIWTVGKVPFDPNIFWPLLGTAGLAGPSVAGLSVLLFVNRPGGMARAYAIAGIVTLSLCLVLIPKMGAAGAAWAVLISEALILSVMIPWQTAKIIGGSPLLLIARIQGTAFVAFAMSGSSAWLALSISGGETLYGLILAGFVWAILVSAPFYFLMFNRSRRQWIGDRLRENFGR